MRTSLFDSPGATTTLLWTYKRCADDEFTVFSAVDTVTCVGCPAGGDCTGGTLAPAQLTTTTGAGVATAAVQQGYITAQRGYWASAHSTGDTFYECPVPSACLPGVNGSRSSCATGYTGVLCSVCDLGYYDQYGLCQRCPTAAKGSSVVASFAVPLFLCALFGVLFAIRNVAPRGLMKVGISMLQIIARCVRSREWGVGSGGGRELKRCTGRPPVTVCPFCSRRALDAF